MANQDWGLRLCYLKGNIVRSAPLDQEALVSLLRRTNSEIDVKLGQELVGGVRFDSDTRRHWWLHHDAVEKAIERERWQREQEAQ